MLQTKHSCDYVEDGNRCGMPAATATFQPAEFMLIKISICRTHSLQLGYHPVPPVEEAEVVFREPAPPPATAPPPPAPRHVPPPRPKHRPGVPPF